jgi:RNA polymerase sigma-70 factor (ECF subfamily)
MCDKKIDTKNGDGSVIKLSVNVEIYNFDKEDFWKQDWQKRKAKSEDSYESLCEIYENSSLPDKLSSESSENEFIRKYEKEFLWEAIDSLPEKQRRRIILRFFHNFTITQIAKIENCSMRAVNTSISKGLQILKKTLEKFKL